MRGKRVEVDWNAVIARFAAGDNPEISVVAREFSIAESTLRSLMTKYNVSRDPLMRLLEVTRARLDAFAEDFAEIERMVAAEREKRPS